MDRIPPEIRALVMACARGSYQHALLVGHECWSGASLRGKAREWAGSYAASAGNLVGRIRAALAGSGWKATVQAVFARHDMHRLVLIAPDGAVFDFAADRRLPPVELDSPRRLFRKVLLGHAAYGNEPLPWPFDVPYSPGRLASMLPLPAGHSLKMLKLAVAEGRVDTADASGPRGTWLYGHFRDLFILAGRHPQAKPLLEASLHRVAAGVRLAVASGDRNKVIAAVNAAADVEAGAAAAGVVFAFKFPLLLRVQIDLARLGV